MDLTRRAFLAACLPSSTALTGGGGAGSGWTPTGHRRPAATGAGGASAISEATWTAIGELLRKRYRDPRRHFLFEYYPWYATEPMRHWQQWDRSPPLDVAANTMPFLGAYDSRTAAVIEQHARWIADAGVGAINLSWWGAGSFEDRLTPLVMDVMRAHDVHVGFHLEPYGPERVDRLGDDLTYLVREYGERRRWDAFFLHERAGGTSGPVFKLFRTTVPQHVIDCHGVRQSVHDFVPDDTWRRATDRARAALDGYFDHVTLLSDTTDAVRARAAGVDGVAVYDPAVEHEEVLGYALAATRLGMPFSPNTNAGLDEIPRRGLPPDSCLVARPFVPDVGDIDWSREHDRERAHARAVTRIEETLEWSLLLQIHPWLGNVALGFFLVYITSFNEWHEGTQFEPMKPRDALSAAEVAVGYRNPVDGFARLDRLTELLRRLGV